MNQAVHDFFDRPSVQTQRKTVSTDSDQIKGNVYTGKTLSAISFQL